MIDAVVFYDGATTLPTSGQEVFRLGSAESYSSLPNLPEILLVMELGVRPLPSCRMQLLPSCWMRPLLSCWMRPLLSRWMPLPLHCWMRKPLHCCMLVQRVSGLEAGTHANRSSQ